jgi:putative ABC transport system permease protein
MMLNYLKLSFRLLARSPFFTFINIAGLSVGFAVFFVLWPFTQSELESDRFITDYKRIERPMYDWRWTDDGGANWGQVQFASVPASISHMMKDHAEIESVTRYTPQKDFWSGTTPELIAQLILSLPASTEVLMKLDGDAAICADENFFSFFDLPVAAGNRENFLGLAESVVLSESLARKIFREDALGKHIVLNGKPFEVTGVFRDLPRNSHFNFQLVVSNVSRLNNWNAIRSPFVYHYFKLKEGSRRLDKILNENKERLIGGYLAINQHLRIDFLSTPLEEVAFSQSPEPFKTRSRLTLRVLAIVSIVVLMMAWMNYVNLTVSRTRTRFKEIAARKVSGALLRDLFPQFICQSAVTNLLAVLIALTLIQLARNPLLYFFEIPAPSFKDLSIGTILFFVAGLIVGVVATASYPAWLTIRYTARQLLTRDVSSHRRATTTIFTTFQYASALTLIAWIFVMNSQLQFILDKDLGIDKENVVIIDAPVIGLGTDGCDRMEEFASHVRTEIGAEGSLSIRVCGDEALNANIRNRGADHFFGSDSHGGIDENYLPVYRITLLAGRNFEKDEKTRGILISRVASERLGFKTPEEAPGTVIQIRVQAELWDDLEILGVFEDYRVWSFFSFQNNTEAANGRGECLTYLDTVWPVIPQRLSVKITDGLATLEKIEQVYKRDFPGNVFTWYFLDEKISRVYVDQRTTRNQLSFFAALAIGVACLGLLGMIFNKVVEKTKEISVRRILGASGGHVIFMLLRSTSAQVAAATLVGLPLAWRFSELYLQKFTEQITLQWWHFALPVLIMLSIMLLSVISVLWKAARTNPVEALKCE